MLTSFVRAGFVSLGFSALIACGSSPPPPAPAGGIAKTNAAQQNDKGIDKAAVADALEDLQEDASRCGVPGGPAGDGKAMVAFDPATGNASEVKISGEPYEGTPVGACVAKVFTSAKVPPYQGPIVKVNARFFVAMANGAPGFSARTARAAVKDAIAKCSLKVRGREPGADEVQVKFKKDGSVAGSAFYRFEDHGPLDESNATKCVKGNLTGVKVPAFSSDEERAMTRAYFSLGN